MSGADRLAGRNLDGNPRNQLFIASRSRKLHILKRQSGLGSLHLANGHCRCADRLKCCGEDDPPWCFNIQALLQGRADGYVADAVTISTLISNYPTFRVLNEEVDLGINGIGLRKNEPELKAFVNAALKKLKEEAAQAFGLRGWKGLLLVVVPRPCRSFCRPTRVS